VAQLESNTGPCFLVKMKDVNEAHVIPVPVMVNKYPLIICNYYEKIISNAS